MCVSKDEMETNDKDSRGTDGSQEKFSIEGSFLTEKENTVIR